MTTYRAVMLTRMGGPEALEQVALPLAAPGPGEVRVAIRATGAGGTDIAMRRRGYRFAPPLPFVPGYEVVGVVDAVGPGVQRFRVGDRVAALTVYGGYAETMVRPAADFVPVPADLDDADVVALILNYVTAFQAIHRVARVRPGDVALVTGANGGVGTAVLDLLRAAGVNALGAASPSRHDVVR
ncbi:MAG: alcohol dehydrogenase catalytic domain-containing protein, partial [Polyangiaceae bacterium]|nr:alcohol dehydrogenase catalytic domain-containing protein [Polyangiaceae bacterium]